MNSNAYYTYYAYEMTYWLHIVLHIILHIVTMHILHITSYICAYYLHIVLHNILHILRIFKYAYYTYYTYWLHIYMHIVQNIGTLHIIHISNIFCILQSSIFCIFYIFSVKILAPEFHSLLTLLLGSPSQGPAIYVPPPTSITTVRWSVAWCSGKVCWFSSHGKCIVPVAPTGTTGRRPRMEDTGITYKTCACSRRS